MTLNKYNKILTLGRWYNKYPKDDKILYLSGVTQNITDDSKKSSDKYIMDPTKGYQASIRDLPHWILEDPKVGLGNRTNDRK